MRQADLHVGSEYALPTYKPYDGAPLVARVRVVSVDGHGKVTVKVVDPGVKPPRNAWNARPVKRGEQCQVSTRDIPCPWEEWADRAASIEADQQARAAERQAWSDDYERRHADRVKVDPTRALPDEYDEESVYPETDAEERSVLAKEYIKARGLGQYATIDELAPLLVDLPVPVLRDILATDQHRQIGAPGTVASVYMRAAELLESARIADMWFDGRARGELPQPAALLSETDIEFVNAIREDVAASGGELQLPPVPKLPNWIDEHEAGLAPVFGWLRLAVADTSGELLHSPGCHIVRSRQATLTDHVPWWQVMLENPREVCSRCNGPGIRDLVSMAGFAAAADVWHARGAGRVERWQQAAFQRLLVATATARARALEPDITLTWRIVESFTNDAPAEEGWDAYTLMAASPRNGLNETVDAMTAPQREAARTLARDRLTTLVAALPPAQRLLPLPQAADTTVLRQRYRQLKDLLDKQVPQLDRLLFTLPDAELVRR